VAGGLTSAAPGAWRDQILEVRSASDRVARTYSRLSPDYEFRRVLRPGVTAKKEEEA
jgi:hypothetical protein